MVRLRAQKGKQELTSPIVGRRMQVMRSIDVHLSGKDTNDLTFHFYCHAIDVLPKLFFKGLQARSSQ
jgi:hypothetical protein